VNLLEEQQLEVANNQHGLLSHQPTETEAVSDFVFLGMECQLGMELLTLASDFTVQDLTGI